MNSTYRVTYQMDEASGRRSRNVRKVQVPNKDLNEECRHAIKEVLANTHKNESVVLLKVVAITIPVRSKVVEPPSWEIPGHSAEVPSPIRLPRPRRRVSAKKEEMD